MRKEVAEMPINIPDTLPANSQLRRENIFVMNED